MKIGKILAYVAAGIFILIGIFFIWALGSPQGRQHPEWLVIGLITLAIGFALIWLVSRRGAAPQAGGENVTLKIDLPANINLDTLKCQSCGGVLTVDNIKMVAGAPVVSCPYCGTTYQLTEEPKW
jgi:hypothetical protein